MLKYTMIYFFLLINLIRMDLIDEYQFFFQKVTV